MRDMAGERRRRAIAAARAIARLHGIECDDPTILQDSNHTVVHLRPAPLVAKVGTSPEEASLADELAVAKFLASRDAPVVPPTSLLPSVLHVTDGLEVTFWEYCPHASEEPTPDVLGQSLRLLHHALDAYPGHLRAWDGFDGVEKALFDPSHLHAISEEDREFLRRRYGELLSGIRSFQAGVRALHGEPHGGNLLLSPRGPRWIDFESACCGPQEWDLTVLPDDVVAQYFQGVDWDLLRVLRQLRSLCVAIWCWLDPDRDPILREAGTHHLAILRTASRELYS